MGARLEPRRGRAVPRPRGGGLRASAVRRGGGVALASRVRGRGRRRRDRPHRERTRHDALERGVRVSRSGAVADESHDPRQHARRPRRRRGRSGRGAGNRGWRGPGTHRRGRRGRVRLAGGPPAERARPCAAGRARSGPRRGGARVRVDGRARRARPRASRPSSPCSWRRSRCGRSSRCEPGLGDLFHIPALEERADGQFETSAATFVMRSRSRGSVRLASDDPRVPPIVDHGLLTDPVDAEVLAEGIAHLRALVASEGLDRLAASETRPAGRVARRARPGGRARLLPPHWDLRMDRSSTRSVACSVSRAYVADASVMPEVPRVNTNLPTAAIAERVAAQLAGTGG